MTKTSSRKEVTGKSCFRKPPWLQENELWKGVKLKSHSSCALVNEAV